MEQIYYKGRVYKRYNEKLMLILCASGFLGFAGLHKFYQKQTKMGILYFLTLGLFLFGTIYDLITMSKQIYNYNAQFDEVVKLKELEEAKRQAQLNAYGSMDNANVRVNMKL